VDAPCPDVVIRERVARYRRGGTRRRTLGYRAVMTEPSSTTIAQRRAERLCGYSDGVVAIASTLLVLPLVDLAAGIGPGDLGRTLAQHGNALLAFVLSFLVISRFWSAHHRLLGSLVGTSRGLITANTFWLLSIVFLPFPTQVIATLGSHDRSATALYIGTMLVSDVAYLAIAVLMSRSSALTRSPVRTRAAVVAVLTMALALAVGVAVPAVGLFALLLLVVPTIVGRWTSRRRAAAPRT